MYNDNDLNRLVSRMSGENQSFIGINHKNQINHKSQIDFRKSPEIIPIIPVTLRNPKNPSCHLFLNFIF